LWGDILRSEKEMMDLILKVAKEDEHIRAVYMEGSRTNPNVTKDIYQDYDIVYVVTETKSFLDNKNWISVFGDIAIVEEPDLVDTVFGIEMDFNRSYTWLMLFKDGNRVDLGIQIKEEALEKYTNDKLTILLLDKDNCLPQMPPSTDEDYWVKKPTESQYTSCCTEFWWCLNNVAKGIARDELPYAMWMYNVVVRDMLVKMIEWYIGINTDFSVSAGKLGKFFKKYLPSELYEMYSKTYSDSDYNNFWEAIFKTCDLFRTVALSVSEHFEYSYNQSEDANMTEYLIKVKSNYFEQES
jgi:aminoglycoside 6-adenylyltransferase